MTERIRIEECALELLDAARRLQSAAEQPGGHTAAPGALVHLEEALQAVSAAWYQLAADAVRAVDRRRDRAAGEASPATEELSRESEVLLLQTLHDVAAAFAGCARACREGRAVAMPIIARATAARRTGHGPVTERAA